MNAVVIEIKNREDADFWLNLAKRTGNKATQLSELQIEDLMLGSIIKEGLKTKDVSREEVMKALDE